MSTPTVSPCTAPGPSPTPVAQLSGERSKEELELAERLIEHSQGARLNTRDQSLPTPSQPPRPEQQQQQQQRRQSYTSTEEESRSVGEQDGEEQSRVSDDGSGQAQNFSLPSIHELTWVKQRKPFNTGMGGAGQVCRYVDVITISQDRKRKC